MNIGFIGLGIMGRAMALRLVDAGHELTVWNRTPGKAPELLTAGALEVASEKEVFERSEIVFSMLANDTAAEMTFGIDPLDGSAGKLHVNMATVSTELSRTLAERHAQAGIEYVAAPVLGRPEVAAAGNLNIVAAGAPAAVERAQPFLDIMGKQTWNVGADPAQASLVKIGVNYNLIHALQAIGESVSLMEHGGVSGETFVEILTDAAFTGAAYKGYGPMIAKREYRPAAFPVPLGLKDLNLALAAADEVGAALPTASVMKDMFTEAIDDPALVDGDWSIVAEVIRRGPAQ